MKRIVTKFKT